MAAEGEPPRGPSAPGDTPGPPPEPEHDDVIATVQAALDTGDVGRALTLLAALGPDGRRELESAFAVRTLKAEDYYEEKPARFDLRWPLQTADPLPLAFEDLDRRTQFSVLFGQWAMRELEAETTLARGDVDAAETIYDECLERTRQLEAAPLVGRACHGLLQVAEKRGDLDAQRAWLSRILRAGGAAGISMLALSRRAAMLELEAGRPQEAERQLTDLIRALPADTDDAERVQHCCCHLDRATVYRSENRWADALTDLDCAERLAGGLRKPRRAEFLASLLFLRAQILSTPFSPAADPAAAAASCSQLRARGTAQWTADVVEATLARDSGDWSLAASLAGRAGEELEGMGWRQGAARCRLMAAEAMVEAGDPGAARGQLEPALDLFSYHGPPAQLAQARLLAARLESAAGNHEGAWGLTVAALDGFDLLIRHFRVLEEQQRFLVDKLRRYDQAFDVALATPGALGTVRAWEVAERSKSFYLSQLVSGQRIDLFDGVPADDIARLRDLELELDSTEQAAGPAPGPGHAQRIRTLSESRQVLLRQMMRDNPRWAAMRVPPRLDMARELGELAPDWIPVSYFWRLDGSGGATLHVFHVDGEGSPRRIGVAWSRQELADLTAASDRLLDLTAVTNSLVPDRLAAGVLPAALREAIPPGSRLLISPHGPLRRLPLHAIGEPLAATCSVQYIPTFSLRALPRRRAGGDEVLLLGCAVNAWGDHRLPGVPEEIRDLEAVWSRRRPGRVRVAVPGPDDTLESAGLAVDRWDRFDVVHCACHGEFPPERPFDAALRLGSTAVRASSFFGMRLGARLVSLSACSLGGQRPVDQVEGDEWVGLYLPLLYAGAERLVTSLWPATDRMAARCMKGLHEGVAAGQHPADALRSVIAGVKPKSWASMWANWFLVGVD